MPDPPSVPTSARIHSFIPTPTGQGYWIVTEDGAVYGFGDAGYFGRVLVPADALQ